MPAQLMRYGRRQRRVAVRSGRKTSQHFDGWPQRLQELKALYFRVQGIFKKRSSAAK